MRRMGIPVTFGSVAMKTSSLLRLGVLAVLCSMICISPTAAHKVGLDGAISPDRLLGTFGTTRYYHFNVERVNKSVNCFEKPIITINGQFPGPTLFANEFDRIVVNVTNNSDNNMTIHFHGVRQVLSPWMDGVAGVSQCPIKPGDYFTHDFLVPNQQGTLLYHAHVGWERATVHGAIITYPRDPPPYQKPFRDFPVILAEWFDHDIQTLEEETLYVGGIFPVSDAITINGRPGPDYNCSAKEGISILKAIPGKTYKLRIINAATNAHLWFSVAKHNLLVVEADAEYVQPFDTPLVFVSPGQTTDVLLTADQEGGTYYMSASDYGREDILKPNPVAILQYETPKSILKNLANLFLNFPASGPNYPALPAYQDHDQVWAFNNALRTINPGHVPKDLDVNTSRYVFTVGLITQVCKPFPLQNCPPGPPFGGPHILGAVNNISFVTPTIALMQASYYNISGVFTEDFPTKPHDYDYTKDDQDTINAIGDLSTKVVPIEYNQTVEVILQDTKIWGFEDHPFHLHGHNFWVMGQGMGDFDPSLDPLTFNDYDPPVRNTIAVPHGGWAAIRLKFNNPGMWFFHCHLDKHASWGMSAVFHVKNGEGWRHSILPPPDRLVQC